MQAKERRYRHFRSSVGSLLNENHGGGYLPDTVSGEDFLFIPTTSLPISNSALQFLEHKFPEPPAVKPPRGSTTESLNNAYWRATGQPNMMVHYDREPIFWASKRRLDKDFLGPDPVKQVRERQDALAEIENWARGLVPSNVSPASTPKSVSSAAVSTRDPASVKGSSTESAKSDKVKTRAGNSGSTFRLSANKHRLWTPGSEAGGFKPYSPFSDSLFDFGKKEAKFIPPEVIPEEQDSFTGKSGAIPVPKYDDAFNNMMDGGIVDGYRGRGNVNVLKVHGNPEYPAKVMEDKDIPNYVAWTKIFPYCPLTQVEGKKTPVKVPPRGFTPSTVNQEAASPYREDPIKVKKNILAGIEPQSRPGAKVEKNTRRSPSLQGLPVRPPPNISEKLMQHQQQKLDAQEQYKKQPPSPVSVKTASSRVPTALSGYEDRDIPRRVLEMKMAIPDVWYSGQTPTHTPTPDHTLPIKPSKTWLKHFSPQRIRHFLAITEPGGSI